ncbi:MAG: restriction endonuclease [Caldilineae bacterium]|nr:MAG: restriction endonuclease [Caldilineae bacterium]
MNISELRQAYHRHICAEIVRIGSKGHPNFADGSSRLSTEIAQRIVAKLGCSPRGDALPGQTAGKRFEQITLQFLQDAFELLSHVRPGPWQYACENTAIANFEQYAHLAEIEQAFLSDATLSSTFGGNYIVRPDIVVSRTPLSDADLDQQGILTSKVEHHAQYTPLRAANQPRPILHAVISCKWTIRHDRAQNTRTEALNLIRHRKGSLPHIVAITAEPFPSRIAALALGTGDLDCVYHFALHELVEAVAEMGNEESQTLVNMMIEGRRLRDVSDLPFDLAV